MEFVQLAATYSKVNLGQGFPDFPPPDFLKDAFVRAVSGQSQALHQYTRAFVRGQPQHTAGGPHHHSPLHCLVPTQPQPRP